MQVWRPSSEHLVGCLVGIGVLALLLLVVPQLSQPGQPRKITAATNPVLNPSFVPLVLFDPEELDAGKLLQGESVTRTFRLRNRSDHAMRVVDMQTTCDCSVVDTNLLGKTLMPQSELPVPVHFNSSNRSGPISPAVLVTLCSDTTNIYIVQGIMRVLVVPDFVYEPKFMEFGRMRPGERATRTILFRPQAFRDLHLTPTQTWYGPFEVLVRDRIVTVTFHAPAIAHSQTYSRPLWVHTTSPRAPQVMIPISGQVVPELEVIPPVLVFANPEPTGVSRLTIRADKPFRVVRVVKEDRRGREALPLASASAAPFSESAWSQVLVVTNQAIAEADRLEAELQFLHGAGRPEARSVSVHIKRLGATNPIVQP